MTLHTQKNKKIRTAGSLMYGLSVDGDPSEEGVPTIGVNGSNPFPGGSRLFHEALSRHLCPSSELGGSTGDATLPPSAI